MISTVKKRISALLAGLLAVSVLTASAGAAELPREFESGKTASVELGNGMVFVTQEDGTLWGWGNANEADWDLLGAGDRHEYVEDTGIYGAIYYQDTPVKLLDDVASVHAGHILTTPFTTAVKTDGSLWYTGQDTDTFRRLDGGVSSAISRIAYEARDLAAWYEIYAVKENGELWRYAMKKTEVYNDQLERTGWDMTWVTPEKVMDGVEKIAAGYLHILVLKTDGSVWAWGDSSVGQLGDGRCGDLSGQENPERGWSDQPVKVMEDAADILADWDFSAAIKTDGSLWVWGDTYWDWNTAGENYEGTGLEFSVLTKPIKLADQVKQAVHTPTCVVFLKQDGTLWAWGEHQLTGLGGADTTSFLAEPAPTGISGVSFMDGSGQDLGYLYYIKQDGSLWYQGWSYDLDKPVTTRLTGVQTQTAAPGFTDVPAGAYYAGAVTWAVKQGITTGTGDGSTFSPDSTCTTAQILTFLWRAVGSPAPAGDSPYAGVAAGTYYADAAAWACEQGLADAASFDGDAPATRAATVTYLWKLAGRPAADAVAFTDVDGDADYAQAVAWAVKEGVTSGTGDGTTFSPDSTCTRGQIATFLYRDMAE